MFQTRASQLLTATELAAIRNHLPLNITTNDSLLPSDLASFLGMTALPDMDRSSHLFEAMYRLFAKLGTLPFIGHTIPSHPQGEITEKEALAAASLGPKAENKPSNQENSGANVLASTSPHAESHVDLCLPPAQRAGYSLTIKSLLVAICVHMHRLPEIWTGFDYVGLLFWALAEEQGETERTVDIPNSSSEKAEQERDPDHFIVKVLQSKETHDQGLAIAARQIDWNTLETLPDLTAENPAVFRNMFVHAQDLSSVFALMLFMKSLATSLKSTLLAELTSTKWGAYETAANALVKHYSASDRISYPQFRSGMRLTLYFQNALRECLQKEVLCKAGEKQPAFEFTSSRLVTEAMVAQVAVMLGSDNVKLAANRDPAEDVAQGVAANVSSVAMSTQNLVELYNGSKSGFSIRSLEQKILNWHAPTILFVAGKRVKTLNKRYQSFDAEFPRYFRSDELSLQPGQSPNDRLMYAVYMSEPWRVSNKANFGNAETVLLALQPRSAAFPSTGTSVHLGRLVYFNTQGMGIGFGNDQPINKNHVRRYNPGSVSLTIEANLEFAVFRHTPSAANSPSFFRHEPPPPDSPLSSADYEDRFVITGLEVWGIGSTKELQVQKRQWEWEEQQAQARQSINLRNMGEDRAFMEMAGLVGNHGSGGSV